MTSMPISLGVPLTKVRDPIPPARHRLAGIATHQPVEQPLDNRHTKFQFPTLSWSWATNGF